MGDIKITDYGRPAPPEDAEQTWTTEEMTRDFEAIGFAAPYIVVRRRADGVEGSLEFTHRPRVYFGFVPKG